MFPVSLQLSPAPRVRARASFLRLSQNLAVLISHISFAEIKTRACLWQCPCCRDLGQCDFYHRRFCKEPISRWSDFRHKSPPTSAQVTPVKGFSLLSNTRPPRHRAAVGSYEGGGALERGAPVTPLQLQAAGPLAWWTILSSKILLTRVV